MMKTLRKALCALALCAMPSVAAMSAGPVQVVIETTEGNITIELSDSTPRHRDNFVRLVESHFYDSLLFHRAIAHFIIQAGDATSRHAQPGHYIGGEPSQGSIEAEICLPQLYHRRGAVAMARRSDSAEGDLSSDATQFYIVWGKRQSSATVAEQRHRLSAMGHGDAITTDMATTYRKTGGTPHLDGLYTVFGYVADGLDVVERISQADTDDYDRPIHDIRIIRVRVAVDPQHVADP